MAIVFQLASIHEFQNNGQAYGGVQNNHENRKMWVPFKCLYLNGIIIQSHVFCTWSRGYLCIQSGDTLFSLKKSKHTRSEFNRPSKSVKH